MLGFSTLALFIFWARYLFAVGAALDIVRYLAASLASTYPLDARNSLPVVTLKNVSRLYQMSPGTKSLLAENHRHKAK